MLLTPGISTGYWNARKYAFLRPLFGLHRQQVLAIVDNFACRHLVEFAPAITCASVLLPEPFGPMMACTSPALIVRSMPFRISARRLLRADS